MFAKRLFYASASLLMLALAYHLGATSAIGQTGGIITDAYDPGLGSFAVTSTGAVYFASYGGTETPSNPTWSHVGTIPAGSSIVTIQEAGGTVVHAFDANGGFWVSTDYGRTWALRGNVVGAPTPARTESFGQLKTRYR